LKAIRKAIHETPTAEKDLSAQADALEKKKNEIARALSGDAAIAQRNEAVPPSVRDRLTNIMEGERFAITKPTQTHQDAYNIAAQEFGEQLAKLRGAIEGDLAKLEKDMEAAGAPWTPGRLPVWRDEK